MAWLSVGTAAAMISHLFAAMNEAVGRFEEKFIIQALTTAISILAFSFAVHFGLEACAAAYAFGWVVFLVGQLVLSVRVLMVDLWTIAAWLAPGGLCALAINVYVFGNHLQLVASRRTVHVH